MPSLPSSGKIHRLELENFKSYKGFQTIGPFFDFTTIIGPNGARKSNLMDAISFVLGVRTGQLRGAQLKDLIYTFDDREKEQKVRRAYSLAMALSSILRAQVESLGILVKARNFLVFQGDVDKDGHLNYGEFVAISVHLKKLGNDDHLHKAFAFFNQKRIHRDRRAKGRIG